MHDEARAAPQRLNPTPWRDLRVRALAGAVLAVGAFLLLVAGQRPFALLVLAIALLMSWEWGRMVRHNTWDVPFAVHAGAITTAVLLAVTGLPALSLAVLGIGALVVLALEFGRRSTMSAHGVFYVGLPAVALLWLRGDGPLGFWAVLMVVGCVVATDTAAFFAGRQFGGPKLWPAVSPNKTWAGLIGGVSASALVATLFSLAVSGASWQRLLVLGVGLALVSQAGDLAESGLKRLFKVKDTSSLIPGHGGFMDRMDGLVAAATAAALLSLLINAKAPARALLLGS